MVDQLLYVVHVRNPIYFDAVLLNVVYKSITLEHVLHLLMFVGFYKMSSVCICFPMLQTLCIFVISLRLCLQIDHPGPHV